MNILFLSAGRRVELIQCFFSAKEKLRIGGNILGADANPLAPALYFVDKRFIVPPIDSDKYVPVLKDVCIKEQVALIIPTIDPELPLMAEIKEEFLIFNIKILISDRKVIKICRNKINTCHFFQKLGLATPKTYAALKDVPNKFPVFIKPVDGSSSINAFKAENKQEMDLFFQYVPKPIIQEYIDGWEYTIDVMCDFQGVPIYITPRKRLAVRAGEVSKTEITHDPTLREEVLKIIAALKPVGPVTIQAIKSRQDRKNYFIEINPRFGGGAPLSMMAGADSAKALFQMLEGEQVKPDIDGARPEVIYIRFDQSIAVKKKGTDYVKI